MNIKLIDFDSEHYAANLSPRGDSLKWESVGATHFMIVRAPFGADIRLTENDVQFLFSGSLITGKEMKLGGDKFFIILPRSGINTCVFSVKPAAYAVFACNYDGNDLTIYNPNDACFYECSVSATVEVSVKKAPVEKKKLFDRIKESFKPDNEEQERRYYNVTLPEMADYQGGLLCYSYEGCVYKFPITAQMLNRTVLIPEWKGRQPRVESLDSNAYKISVV
jgi:hypothetical protein